MEGSIKDLSKYRFENSIEALEDAKLLFENGRYKSALNKGYYSIFYGIRAVNALDGYDSSKHSGVIAHFNHEYVKAGIFTKEASKVIKKAFESRERFVHGFGFSPGTVRKELWCGGIILSELRRLVY